MFSICVDYCFRMYLVVITNILTAKQTKDNNTKPVPTQTQVWIILYHCHTIVSNNSSQEQSFYYNTKYYYK